MSDKIHNNEYADINYLQFTAGKKFRIVQAILGVLSWPLVLPLALLARTSDILFRTFSEFFSVLPYFPGVILRYEFYRFSLRKCGRNVVIEFGTVFIYPDIEIGDNVLIGRFNIIHHCDFDDYVLVGERCTFLSGSQQHNYADISTPIALQGGKKKRIRIGRDSWIGSHCVVMETVGTGSIVAAGSVVQKQVEQSSIVAGVPAKLIRKRE